MKRDLALGLTGLGLVVIAARAPGCGSSAKSDPNNAASTATSGGGGDDTQPSGDDGSGAGNDAGGAVDPHSVYPAAHPAFPKMHNAGGRVIGTPNIVTVTFAGMDTTIRDAVRAFDDGITKTPYWDAIVDGYGVGEGTAGGSVELPDTFSNVTTDDNALQTWLGQQITTNALPQPTDDTIYVLFIPAAATIALQGSQSCSSFGGYHFSGDVTLNAKSQRYYYAVIDECYAGFSGTTSQDIIDELTMTTSHELAEAVTDPDVDHGTGAYYMMGNDAWAPNQRGGEVGDVCENYSGTKQDAWAVQTIWNQKAADESRAPCQPAAQLYYGAIPHTQVPGQTIGGAPVADGYIVAQAGQTTTVEVDVFSTEAMPAPFTVVAGRSRFSQGDPTQVNPVKGVTMSLSSATATNGDKLTLSITVDASVAHKTTNKFVVRSVVSATDYHSWPVLLYTP